jgi:hypothetical protein
VTPTATPTAVHPSITVIATPSEISVSQGTNFEIKFYLENNGDDTATGIILGGDIAPELLITGAAGNSIWAIAGQNVSISVPVLAPGASVQFSIFVSVNVKETPSGQITTLPFTVQYTGASDTTPRTAATGPVIVWIGKIRVYPNPFNPELAVNGVMKFINLPYGAKVEIYSVSGELVMQYKSVTQAYVWWDCTNYTGSKVSPGIYYYIILPDNEQKPFQRKVLKRGKIFVVNN